MMMTLTNFNPDESIITLSDEEFRLIARLVYSRFGIRLSEKKRMLIRGRLNTLLHTLHLSSFKEYYDLVLNDPTPNSLLAMIDRLSTNYSYFYREKDHYDFIVKTVFPEILETLTQSKNNEIRIWIAGCATGEEAYTTAMIILYHFNDMLKNKDFQILATDISVTSLEKAKQGIYNEESIRFLPPLLKQRFLKKTAPDTYMVSSELKHIISFKRLNLKNTVFPFKKKFHIIFCRNVMIFFDQKSREDLVTMFHKYMHSLSYLFIGHSESIGDSSYLFQYIQSAVFKKC